VQIALEAGTDMVGWWQDEGDPQQLYIEARTQSGDIPVVLTAFLSELTGDGDRGCIRS
jgi:hypothetical protein